MTNDFNEPGVGGDQFSPGELNGSLLLFTIHEETGLIETKFGPNTAIRADIAVLDGTHKGDVIADTLIFPRVLKGQLRGSIGGKVLGRLGQGVDKKGNPPWQLTPPTDAEKETGRKYLAYVASQAPQPVTVPDEEPW